MAYTNFTNCTKQEYEDIIYSQNDSNRIRIWFNNVELDDADEYCISLTGTNRMLPDDGSKRFSLENFVSKEYNLILRDLPSGTIIADQVKISIGTLVNESNNTYEDVPIGIFNIQDTPISDKDQVTIKLRDNRVKFDFYYNAQPLIEQNEGTATLGQILNDICNQANVENNVGHFKGEDTEVSIYDNTIYGSKYVAWILGQAGLIPTINRLGQLDKIDLTESTTHIIPLDIIEKYDIGTQYRIERVVYESGIIKYESSNDESLNTLYLDAANPYITSQEQVDYIFNKLKGFQIDSVVTGSALGNPTIDSYDLVMVHDSEVNESPTTTGNGTNITLENTIESPMRIELGVSELTQDGTPTPSSPQDIHTISGSNKVVVCGKNLAYTEWASNFVSRINNSSSAKLETYDSKNCLYYYYNAGARDLDNKFIFKTNWKANTQYTINFDLYSNYSPNMAIYYTDNTYQAIPRSSITINTWNSLTITSQANKTIKYIATYGEGGYDYINLDTFMVYEGTENLPYEPYQSQSYTISLGDTELCKIGDYQDYIYKENGNWYLYKTIGKVVLDGSETNWNIYGTGTSNWFYYLPLTAESTTALCNNYSYNMIIGSNTNEGFYLVSNYLRIRYGTEDTLENYKTWLSTHNTIVYYILATPTTTQITGTLAEQLEYIYNQMLAYKGQTNISQINNDLPFELNVSAFNDSVIFITLANNTYTYKGNNRNKFDTQIGKEQRTENVSVDSQNSLKKWAKTNINNLEGEITLTAGDIDNLEGRVDKAEFKIDKQSAKLDIVSTNIDAETGNVLALKTTSYELSEKGFKIDDGNGYRSVSNTTGNYYYDNDTMLGKYTKDGSVQKDMALFGRYYYGIDEDVNVATFSKEDSKFVGQLYTNTDLEPPEKGFGHFWNGD